MLLLLTQTGFFPDIYVFPQPSSIGLFEPTIAHLYLEKHTLQELFLSKTSSILSGKQGARR
jgi:hypothetical protein